MSTICGGRMIPHSTEEKEWAQQKVDQGITTLGKIASHNLPEELERLSGRKITVAGLYSWFRFTKNPELKKIEYEKKKLYARQAPEKANARFLREKETFEKSNILAYVNHHIVGFESDVELKDFMIKNQVIGEKIFVFKKNTNQN